VSTEKLPSGKFRAVVRYQGIKRTSKAVGTLKAARLLEAQLLMEMGGNPDPSDATVSEMLTTYFDTAQAKLSPTTMETYRRSIGVMPAAFLKRPVRAVTPHVLDAMYASLMKAGETVHRAEKVHALLSVAFGQAVRYQWCSVNPCRDATKPKPTTAEIKPPSVDDVQRLIGEASTVNDDLPVFLRLAATTGARRGELVALKWADIAGNRMSITRSFIDVGGGVQERPTKTGARGHRVVTLDAKTVAEIEALHERQASLASEHLLPAPRWVFSHDAGVTPWRPNYATLAFIRLAKTLGIATRLHDLRHYSATSMLSAGVAPLTVAGRLGHSTTATTLRTYAHFVPGADKDAAEELGAAI